MLPRRPNAGLPSNPRSGSAGGSQPLAYGSRSRNSSPDNRTRQQFPDSRQTPRSRSRPPESSRSTSRNIQSSRDYSSRSEAGSRYTSSNDKGYSPRSEAGDSRPTRSAQSSRDYSSRSEAGDSRSSRFAQSSRHYTSRSEVGGPSSRRHGPSPSRPEAGDSYRRSDGSTNSSSGSSLFDRSRTRGYESSRTSLEDDRTDRKRAPPLDLSQSLRGRRLARSEPPSPRYDDSEPEVRSADSTASGEGYSIWSKVASAASSLTVSVGKAWAANVSTLSGEETPVGGESRLTQAMKAYHAEKAASPTDLPVWLFDERERTPAPTHKTSESYGRSEESYKESPNEPPRPRGLRSVYDRATANNVNTAPVPRPTLRGGDGEVKSPTKATDRLKALRDAKRGVASREEEILLPHTEARQKRRVGLPSGPRAF